MKQFLIVLIMFCITSISQAADWKSFQYLIGEWNGTVRLAVKTDPV